MHKWMIVVLMAGMICFGGSVALAAAHRTAAVPRAASSEKLVDENKATQFSAKMRDNGIEFEPLDGTPQVSKDAALEIAKKEEGERISSEAELITATFGNLSDYPMGPNNPPLTLPGTDLVLKDTPAWIVAFHGAHMLHSGPCMMDANGNRIPSTSDPYVFGDANVVVDAETGEVLEGFSYSTPSAAQN
jgi:hypothetical protein